MDVDLEEHVQLVAAEREHGERLIRDLLAIREGALVNGRRVWEQADDRATAAYRAGQGRCVAAVLAAQPAQLGRLYVPLLAEGGVAACWAVLLAAACGRGHRRATDAALKKLDGSGQLRPAWVQVSGDRTRWVCQPRTLTALERGLGLTPGNLAAGVDDRSMHCRSLVASLRELSDAELRWWADSGVPLSVGGYSVLDPASGSCNSLVWLSYFSRMANASAAGQVAARMTVDSAGATCPDDMVFALAALRHYRPELVDELFATYGGQWQFSAVRRDLQPPYRFGKKDAGGEGPVRTVWDGPLAVAHQFPEAAVHLWHATGTAPSVKGLLTAASDRLCSISLAV